MKNNYNNMEETKVSLEVAKLARDCGFNISSNVVFDLHKNNKIIDFRDIEVEEFIEDCSTGYRDKALNYLKEYYYRKTDNSDSEVFLLAPTQSLLQKWIREIHEISITVEDREGGGYNSLMRPNKKGQGHMWTREAYSYSTYEHALEVALASALNIIFITNGNTFEDGSPELKRGVVIDTHAGWRIRYLDDDYEMQDLPIGTEHDFKSLNGKRVPFRVAYLMDIKVAKILM